MKKWIGVFVIACSLVGCASISEEATTDAYVKGHWATVTDVADGDTLELDEGEKVRLVGVNTPETVKPNTPVQPYGKEASEFTKQHLQGKRVYVEVDVQPKDKYGRTLAYVYTQAPRSAQEVETYMFNATLLREGYAQVMTIPPNVRYQDLFVKLQRTAREDNKGLWALGLYKDSVKSTNDIFLENKNPAPETAQPVECDKPAIKGNKSSKGEKIFHVPGGNYYDRTVAEELFCTEQDAIDAGYRKSQQ